MRDIDEIEVKIKSIIRKICNRDINEMNTNIFIHPINMSSRELAYIFLEIEKELEVNLNELVAEFKVHTIEELINTTKKLSVSFAE